MHKNALNVGNIDGPRTCSDFKRARGVILTTFDEHVSDKIALAV